MAVERLLLLTFHHVETTCRSAGRIRLVVGRRDRGPAGTLYIFTKLVLHQCPFFSAITNLRNGPNAFSITPIYP